MTIEDQLQYYRENKKPVVYTTYRLFDNKFIEIDGHFMKFNATNALTTREVKPIINYLITKQEHRCTLCGLPLDEEHTVLDYDKETGYIKAAIHDSCRRVLKNLDTCMTYNNMTKEQFTNILDNFFKYLDIDCIPVMHPRVNDKRTILNKTKA
jgi:hypothetical protein